MILGIDPGWASCGVAVQDSGVLLRSFHFVPREIDKTGNFDVILKYLAKELDEKNDVELDLITDLNMERYVAYKGVQSEIAEQILMFIGALKYWAEDIGFNVNMVRAIDWKPKICKHLVRTQGFNNPYPSFDKKYSILAATTLSGKTFKTDHEADAVCLSYLNEVPAKT